MRGYTRIILLFMSIIKKYMNKGEGRTMRKAIATILAMGLVLSMTACGGTGGTTSENTANADSAKEESTSDGEVYEMSIAHLDPSGPQ